MTSHSDNNGEDSTHSRSHQSSGVAPASVLPPGDGRFYRERLGQRPEPDLDANAPFLKSREERRLNRRALAFMAALVVLMALAATWMFNGLIHRGDSARHKPREEMMSVPAAPTLPASQVQAEAPAQPIQVVPTPAPPLPRAPEQPAAPRGPSLMERRMMDSNVAAAVGVNAGNPAAMLLQQQMAGLQGAQQGSPESGGESDAAASAAAAAVGEGGGISVPAEFAMPGNSAYQAKALDKTRSAQPLLHPDTIMTRGTYIRCVLETHIVTDVPGFTSCIVTEPVYSFTGRRLLLPKGSKMLGQYNMAPNTARVAVIWDRVITPNGIDVNMASPGIDIQGGAGHPGYLDNHWGQRIGAALLISMLSDAFSYEAAKHGPSTTTVTSNMAVETPWQSNTAQTLQNLANQAVRQAANRPPTVTINQGAVVYVYVARDIDFSGVLARS
jgi:type IV secretion system protein VirB10